MPGWRLLAGHAPEADLVRELLENVCPGLSMAVEQTAAVALEDGEDGLALLRGTVGARPPDVVVIAGFHIRSRV